MPQSRSAIMTKGNTDASGNASSLLAIGGGALPSSGRARRRANGVEPRGAQAGKSTLIISTAHGESRQRWVRGLRDVLAVHEIAGRRPLERAMADLKPDLLVIDLALPGLGRLRGLRDMRQLSPSTRIVAMTDLPTDTEGVRALKSGAMGYCARTIDLQELRKAVAAVQKGEIWATRKLISRLLIELQSLTGRNEKASAPSRGDARLRNLTPRQRAIADLISEGACNKEVAERLRITERTVKAHLTGAFRNVGVTDRLQLALLLKGLQRESE
jgi:DNA-binding NarL/FixJ family response regulator